jgi:polar amino acid transport system substrate-binding protein
MKHAIVIILAVLCLGWASCKKEDTTGKDLTLLCEVMEPYNYEVNGELKGITADLVARILLDLELDNPITISSDWASIFNRLNTEENIMLFTTGLTADRKGLFQWVGPVAVMNTAFVSLKNSGLSFSTPEDAMKQSAIGVVTSYPTGGILAGLGFTNLVYFDSLDEMVRKLFDGTVPVIFDNPDIVQAAARKQSLDASKLNNLLTYSSTPVYLAFSAGVPAKVVETWQGKLDALKDGGFLQTLFDIYLPGTRAPGRILMFADENPPFNYLGADGTLTGSTVDMVEAMMEGTNLGGPFEYTTWTTAFNQLQLVPNSMAFSTQRTPAMEDLFQWVGPVGKSRNCFFVLSGTEYHVGNINDAYHMRSIGAVTGSTAEQEMLALGFLNVVTWATPQQVFLKLVNGDIPCIALNELTIKELAFELGHPPKDYRKESVLSEVKTYLAFSNDTDIKYIRAWENAYDLLVSSGKLTAIWKGWHPDVDW